MGVTMAGEGNKENKNNSRRVLDKVFIPADKVERWSSELFLSAGGGAWLCRRKVGGVGFRIGSSSKDALR
jgi:hypothetical protein